MKEILILFQQRILEFYLRKIVNAMNILKLKLIVRLKRKKNCVLRLFMNYQWMKLNNVWHFLQKNYISMKLKKRVS